MKNILLTITIAVITLASCEYDRLPVYEDVDRIYFEFASLTDIEFFERKIDRNQPDKIQIRFGYDKVPKEDSIIQVDVKVMGHATPYDRPVTAALIGDESSAVEGVDFEILPSVVPANSLTGTLNIRLINGDTLQETTLRAKIRLTPSEHFHVDYTQVAINENLPVTATEYSIYFDSNRDMPGLWVDAASSARLKMYFGEYSKKKVEVICLVCGFPDDHFEYDAETYATPMDCLNARIPGDVAGLSSYWLMINHYVLDWEKVNGTELLDENKQRLFDTFSVTQTSFI
ncbi:MAG: DUF4843 domain-containing protein [Proteiniphilum sp.]|jgi:hypothetical protein|nr:DUF4843 domain-containing protein [Proteiniphilum sp.]